MNGFKEGKGDNKWKRPQDVNDLKKEMGGDTNDVKERKRGRGINYFKEGEERIAEMIFRK